MLQALISASLHSDRLAKCFYCWCIAIYIVATITCTCVSDSQPATENSCIVGQLCCLLGGDGGGAAVASRKQDH